MNHFRTILVALTVIAGSAAIATPPAMAADSAVSSQFSVQLNFHPDVSSWNDTAQISDCGADPSGAMVCILDGPWADLHTVVSGAITDNATGAVGQLRAICRVNAYTHVDFSIAPAAQGSSLPTITLVNLGGNANLNCTWSARFNDAAHSTMVGSATGGGTISAANPGIALAGLAANLNLNVIGGTGSYSGLVGAGQLSASATFPMLGSSGELPIDFEIVGASSYKENSVNSKAFATTAGAQSGPGSMSLNLTTGKPSVHLLAPRRISGTLLPRSLQGVTVPGSVCKLSAKRGGKSLQLGSSTADRNGTIQLPRGKKSILSSGSWLVAASCGTNAGSLTASTRVSVTK